MFSLASDNDNLGNFYLEDTALTKKKNNSAKIRRLAIPMKLSLARVYR